MYTIQIDLPHANAGALVEVDKFGVVENGGTYEVTPEQAIQFEAVHGKSMAEVFENMYGVTFTDDDPEEPKADPEELQSVDTSELPDEALQEMLEDQGLDTEGTHQELVARVDEGEGN